MQIYDNQIAPVLESFTAIKFEQWGRVIMPRKKPLSESFSGEMPPIRQRGNLSSLLSLASSSIQHMRHKFSFINVSLCIVCLSPPSLLKKIIKIQWGLFIGGGKDIREISIFSKAF